MSLYDVESGVLAEEAVDDALFKKICFSELGETAVLSLLVEKKVEDRGGTPKRFWEDLFDSFSWPPAFALEARPRKIESEEREDEAEGSLRRKIELLFRVEDEVVVVSLLTKEKKEGLDARLVSEPLKRSCEVSGFGGKLKRLMI